MSGELIRTAVLDDEPLAVAGLVQLLESEPDFEVVFTCGAPSEAVAELRERPVDLLFLDIEMPGMDGFGVLRELATGVLPQVVFVTAFDQYAVRAFEADALDYLLKPVDLERFQACLARVRGRLGMHEDAGTSRALREALGREPGRVPFLERIHARAAGNEVRVDVDEIDWVEARQNYVLLHCDGREVLHRMTLADLEAQLDPRVFVRVHRSRLLRLEALQELRSGASVALLADGTELAVSRAYREPLRAAWGQD